MNATSETNTQTETSNQGPDFRYGVLNTHQLAIRLGLSYGATRRLIEQDVIHPCGFLGDRYPIFFASQLTEYKLNIELAKAKSNAEAESHE